MSLKNALNKRSHSDLDKNLRETATAKKKPMPSLNEHISAYASTPEKTPRSRRTQSADRIVTIGESVVLKGDISECDKVEVGGELVGTIKAGSIQISESGSVSGTLECDQISIAGTVEGKVTSNKTLEIRTTGKLTGEILYEELLVTSGGEISGSMDKLSAKTRNPTEA